MERRHVEGVRIEGYRCVKAVDLRLTPLHALIGPNDSGKSSILRAIADGAVAGWWVAGLGSSVKERWSDLPFPKFRAIAGAAPEWRAEVAKAFQSRAVLRLDPDAMRAPRTLIPAGKAIWFDDEKGGGLPALYDALLSRDIPAFTAIGDRMRQLFPTVRALRMHNVSSSTKQLGLTLTDGTAVDPAEMSEGMLYWLAFAILEHLAPQSIVLVEEPENGLHPARIKEVMRILREVSQRTQIILATHSPLVINELQPEEVTIVTRTSERGTICTPMTETRHFATRSKIYALGELWLSYADGDLERELMPEDQGVARAG